MTSVAQQGLSQARRGVGVGGRGPRGRSHDRTPLGRSWRTLVLFAAPSLVLLVLLNFFPVVYAILQSLQDGTPSTLPWDASFVGLANYVSALTSPQSIASAGFTLVFTVVGVFGSWVVGLAFALLLRTRIPGNTVFKVLLLLPWIVPVVVSSTAWNWMVATPQSPLPVLFSSLGFPNTLFLADPLLAQIMVCIFKVWISFPFMMMMTSSALASVDVNVYEAAKVDGAGRWQTFTGITLPMISRSTYISWILMTIFCVNDFPTIFLLTAGGPSNATTSLIVLAYQYAFQNLQTGPATAIAFLMTLILVLISVALYRQIRKVNIE